MDRIEEITRRFVAELHDAFRMALIEELEKRGSNKLTRAVGKAKKAHTEPGAKRTPEQLVAQTKTLLGAIKHAPGLTIEALAVKLRVESRVLLLPLKRLMGDGDIRKEGSTRATKYFVAKAKK